MSSPAVVKKQVGVLSFPGIAHFIVILIIAAIETVGLILWLALETEAGVISVLGSLLAFLQQQQTTLQIGQTTFAGIVLGVFLLVEHIITQIDQTGKLSARAFGQILVFTAIEVVIWIVWLLLIPINPIVAFLFFLGTLFVEHQIADNVKKGLGFLHFSSLGSRVFQGLLVVTIAEVVGAVIWVSSTATLTIGSVTLAVGIVVLAVFSVIEHYIARNVAQIRE